MHIALHIVVMVLRSVIIIVHSVGLYAILSLYRQGRSSSQRLYLLHICVSRGIFNLLWTIINYMEYPAPILTKDIKPYVTIASYLGLNFVWYLDMVWMIFDRLAKFVLKLNYVLYWDERKTRRLLNITWLLGFLLFVAASCSYRFASESSKQQWKKYIFEILHLPMDVIVITVTVAAYSVIYRKVERSSRQVSMCSTSTVAKRRNAPWQRKRVIVVPVVVLVVFTICQTIPDIVTIVSRTRNSSSGDDTEETCSILYGISNIANALIYVCHLEDIRRFLIGKLFAIVKPFLEDVKAETPRTLNVPIRDVDRSEIEISNVVASRCSTVPLEEVLDRVRGQSRTFIITTQV